VSLFFVHTPGAKTRERICTIDGSKRVKSGKNVPFGGFVKKFYPHTQYSPNSENFALRKQFLAQNKYKSWRKRCQNSFSNRKQPMGISRICGEFLTQPNSTKIGIQVGVADVINRTKFDNDRCMEYKVTEGRILACSMGMACRV